MMDSCRLANVLPPNSANSFRFNLEIAGWHMITWQIARTKENWQTLRFYTESLLAWMDGCTEQQTCLTNTSNESFTPFRNFSYSLPVAVAEMRRLYLRVRIKFNFIYKTVDAVNFHSIMHTRQEKLKKKTTINFALHAITQLFCNR